MNHPVYTRCRVWRAHRGFHDEVLKLGTCRAWHVSITQHDASRRVVYRSPFMTSFDTWREAMDHALREVHP
jgi:hypothetical protein